MTSHGNNSTDSPIVGAQGRRRHDSQMHSLRRVRSLPTGRPFEATRFECMTPQAPMCPRIAVIHWNCHVALNMFRSRSSMKLLTAFFVLFVFLSSLHGRIEPESLPLSAETTEQVSCVDEQSFPPPMSAPVGNHKDKHGCYHSHMPYTLVATPIPLTTCTFSFSSQAVLMRLKLFSARIPHPPRV